MSHIPSDDPHDQQHDEQHDERLLARIHGADPAADLPPLSQDGVDDLLGALTGIPRRTSTGDGKFGRGDRVGEVDGVDESAAASSAISTTAASSTEASGPQVEDLVAVRRRHQRRRWGAAGLGLAAAAAGVIALTTGLPGMPGGTGTTQVSALQAAGPASGGPATMCEQLEAALLSSFDVAFQGRVVEVRPVAGGEEVVLEVERVYRGDIAQQVKVSTPDADSLLDGTVSLVQGGDYLVAASQGQVAGCGATGETSSELGALYEQAFGVGR